MAHVFSHQVLRGIADDDVYERGLDYFEPGRVGRLRREGQRIEAMVQGSRLHRVRLDLEQPGRSTCTCPYGGICKHVVAAGLAWLEHNPQPGQQTETSAASPLASSLERVPAEELRAFLLRLVAQHDSISTALDQWLFSRMLRQEPTGDLDERLDALEERLDEILEPGRLAELGEDAFHDWSEEGQAAEDELQEIEDELDAVASDLAGLPDKDPLAIPALQLLCERVATADEESEQVSGRWHGPASRAADELAGRLKPLGSSERLRRVRALMPAFAGGAHFMEPVMRTAQGDERAAVGRELAALGGWYARPIAIELLVDAGFDDEALAVARGAESQASRLLRMLGRLLGDRVLKQRGDEHLDAVALDKSLACFREALRMTPHWEQSGIYAEIAEACGAAGRKAEEVAARVEAFRCERTLECWQAAVAAAEGAARRPEIQAELLGWLRQAEPHSEVLCSVLAYEGRADASLLAEAVALARSLDSSELTLEVAAACPIGSDREVRAAVCDLLAAAAEQYALQGMWGTYVQAAKAALRLRDLDAERFAHWYPVYRARHRRRRNLLKALVEVGL